MLKDGNVEIASLAELSRLVGIAKGKTFDEYIYETSPKGNTIVYDKDGKQVMIIGPLSDELKDALRDDNLWMWPSTEDEEVTIQDMALGFTPEVSYTAPSGIKFWISEDGEQAGYLPPGGDEWRKIKPLKTHKGQGGSKFYYRLEAKVNIPTTKIGDAETPKEGFRCVICGDWTLGWGEHKQFGNNPYPLSESGECCDECNQTRVIPARIRMARIKHKDASPEEDVRYVVIRKGGSLGSQEGYVPELQGVVVAEFDTAEEAKAEAKLYRSHLTPGEKEYYRMSYVTRPIRADKLARLNAKDEAVRNVVYTHILVPYLYGDVNGNKPKSIPMGTEWAVHHLDADASNNSKNNLLLMSKEDHDRLEAIATKVDNKNATPEEIKELQAIAKKYKVEADVSEQNPLTKDAKDVMSEISAMMCEFGYDTETQFQEFLADISQDKFSAEHYKAFNVTKDEIIEYAKAVKAWKFNSLEGFDVKIVVTSEEKEKLIDLGYKVFEALAPTISKDLTRRFGKRFSGDLDDTRVAIPYIQFAYVIEPTGEYGYRYEEIRYQGYDYVTYDFDEAFEIAERSWKEIIGNIPK